MTNRIYGDIEIDRTTHLGAMTTVERDALIDVRDGSTIYNTDTGYIQIRTGVVWGNLVPAPAADGQYVLDVTAGAPSWTVAAAGSTRDWSHVNFTGVASSANVDVALTIASVAGTLTQVGNGIQLPAGKTFIVELDCVLQGSGQLMKGEDLTNNVDLTASPDLDISSGVVQNGTTTSRVSYQRFIITPTAPVIVGASNRSFQNGIGLSQPNMVITEP